MTIQAAKHQNCRNIFMCSCGSPAWPWLSQSSTMPVLVPWTNATQRSSFLLFYNLLIFSRGCSCINPVCSGRVSRDCLMVFNLAKTGKNTWGGRENMAAENENRQQSYTFFVWLGQCFDDPGHWPQRSLCAHREEKVLGDAIPSLLGTQAKFQSHPFLIIIVRDFSTPASFLFLSQAIMGPSWRRWEGGPVPWQCRYSRSDARGVKPWSAVFVHFAFSYTSMAEVLPDSSKSFIEPCTITKKSPSGDDGIWTEATSS